MHEEEQETKQKEQEQEQEEEEKAMNTMSHIRPIKQADRHPIL